VSCLRRNLLLPDQAIADAALPWLAQALNQGGGPQSQGDGVTIAAATAYNCIILRSSAGQSWTSDGGRSRLWGCCARRHRGDD
jgi:hypothetical protein